MPAAKQSSYMPSSRSKTGRVLSDAERRQRKAAAEESARRRRKAVSDARGTGRRRSGTAADTDSTSGLGNRQAAGFVDQNGARSAFEKNGVSGANVTQRKEPKSGFLVFAGSNEQSHQGFLSALSQMGFMTSIGADGSGIAINRAGQAIKIGPSGRSMGAAPKRRKLERTARDLR